MRRRARILAVAVTGMALFVTACSTPNTQSAEDVETPTQTIVDGEASLVTGSTLDRNQEGVDAAVACARTEVGVQSIQAGEFELARERLEEGIALAFEIGVVAYAERATELQAALDATDDLDAALPIAQLFLEQCGADGFELLD